MKFCILEVCPIIEDHFSGEFELRIEEYPAELHLVCPGIECLIRDLLSKDPSCDVRRLLFPLLLGFRLGLVSRSSRVFRRWFDLSSLAIRQGSLTTLPSCSELLLMLVQELEIGTDSSISLHFVNLERSGTDGLEDSNQHSSLSDTSLSERLDERITLFQCFCSQFRCLRSCIVNR